MEQTEDLELSIKRRTTMKKVIIIVSIITIIQELSQT